MRAEMIQLEADERILMRVRKHWFILALQFFSIVVVALFPVILFGLLQGIVPDLAEAPPRYERALTAFYVGWLLLSWMALFSIWTNYYLDVWTVTNKRLIVVDQKGFFVRKTASFRLERLQDIIVAVDGIIPTLLDYGSLEIQTAGVEKNFKENGLPSPSAIKAAILSSADTLLKGKPVSGT